MHLHGVMSVSSLAGAICEARVQICLDLCGGLLTVAIGIN